MILGPNKCCISLLICERVFLLKNREIFFLLMAWSEASSYCPSMCIRFLPSSTVAWQKRRLSFVNKKMGYSHPWVLERILYKIRFSSTLHKTKDRPSTHNRNKYSDSGSPCLMLIVEEINPRDSSFMSTE